MREIAVTNLDYRPLVPSAAQLAAWPVAFGCTCLAYAFNCMACLAGSFSCTGDCLGGAFGHTVASLVGGFGTDTLNFGCHRMADMRSS